MDTIEAALAAYPWGIYAFLLIAPFVQEDAAVIGAASASSMGMGEPALLFAALIIGLSASDLWKYWAGRAARMYQWAEKFSQKSGVQTAGKKVLEHLGQTLIAVRFIPGTRIPTYVASGFFKVPFGPFAAWVVFSGMLYGALIFGLFHALGQVGGEKARAIIPLIAITLVVAMVIVQIVRRKLGKKTTT